MADAENSSSTHFVWKHARVIIASLMLLFLVAIVSDVVLWYTLNKNNHAMESLSDIIARQPPAPKTEEEKIKVLDNLAAAHAIAAAQVEAARSAAGASAGANAPTTVPEGEAAPAPTDPTVKAKTELLDSMKQNTQ